MSERAFTLLELLLVLSLLVVLVSIAGLSLREGLRQQRLRKGAEQVRLCWAESRVAAIKTGRVHVFYHAVNHGRYFVSLQQSLEDPVSELGTDTTMQFGDANRNGWQGDGTGLGLTRQRTLPPGIQFVAADIQFDQRSALHLQDAVDPMSIASTSFGSSSAAAGITPGETAPDEWGMPIYFFPDGSSSSARLLLQNDQRQSISIYLRGLTGIARIGGVDEGGGGFAAGRSGY